MLMIGCTLLGEILASLLFLDKEKLYLEWSLLAVVDIFIGSNWKVVILW